MGHTKRPENSLRETEASRPHHISGDPAGLLDANVTVILHEVAKQEERSLLCENNSSAAVSTYNMHIYLLPGGFSLKEQCKQKHRKYYRNRKKICRQNLASQLSFTISTFIISYTEGFLSCKMQYS